MTSRAVRVACATLLTLALLPAAGASASDTATAADRAREQARDVLAQRRFQPTGVPAPLRSVREQIGAALRSLGRPFEKAYDWIASWLPGGSRVLGLGLVALALLAGALLAARVAAGRPPAGDVDDVGAGGRPQRDSAASLRREAERAERRGDLDEALRLHFRAGLVELDNRDLIELRPALTNHELLRAVPSQTLAGLVEGFEAVAYGGRPADHDDVSSARDGWPRVPEEASR